jgi:hypothetical protein
MDIGNGGIVTMFVAPRKIGMVVGEAGEERKGVVQVIRV